MMIITLDKVSAEAKEYPRLMMNFNDTGTDTVLKTKLFE